MRPLNFLLLPVALILLPASVSSQKIYINQVAEYSSLPSCAVNPLSTIVRDMYSGCGDGGALTSFSCFCVESSSHFNSVVASAVSSTCNGTVTDVVSAIEVFQSYCQLGMTTPNSASATATTGTTATSSAIPSSSSATITSSSANPSSTISSSLVSPTSIVSSSSIPAPSQSAASSGLSTGAKAGIAIAIVFLVLASLAGLGYFLIVYRRHKHESHVLLEQGTAPGGQGAGTEQMKATSPSPTYASAVPSTQQPVSIESQPQTPSNFSSTANEEVYEVMTPNSPDKPIQMQVLQVASELPGRREHMTSELPSTDRPFRINGESMSNRIELA